jgi:hypothetical protein
MAEHEDQTAADDAVVRRAMATLRADVEATPLADVRFVRARGKARRRQRLLTWGAAAAAAVVVAGVAGYAALGTDRTPAPLPPQSSSTTTAAPTPAYAALPTLADWRTDLGIEAKALTRVVAPPTVLCGAPLPSGFVDGYSVGSDASHPGGFALHFRPTGTTGTQAATALAEAVEKCRAPYTVLPHYRDPFGAAWVTNSLGSGYVGVASTKDAVSVLLYTDPKLTADPLMAGFGDLLNTAQKRLEAAGSSAPSSLDQPGALPLPSEWKRSLGLTGTAGLTPVKPFEAVECLSSEPGTTVQQEQVTVEGVQFEGGQTRFAIGEGQSSATAAEGVTNDIAGCTAGPGFKVTWVQTNGFPKLFSYTAGDAGSGWFAVVVGPRDVGVLQVVDPSHPTSAYTRAQVEELAKTAMARLKRYGTGTSATPTTNSPTVTGPKAIDEDMPVSGPDPKPSSTLFVAASQWTSKPLTGGARATAGPGALEGSTAIASCETDKQQAGIGGSVGVVSIRTGSGSANYVGHQRVQVDQSTDPTTQQGYVKARLNEAQALYAKGCSFANGTVKSTPGPTGGTYRLDTVFTDGSPTLSEWVGVTAQQTPGAVSTVVITKAADPKQGFAELDRLLNLARQK